MQEFKKVPPVLKISNFDDYNNCMKFDENFYTRRFSDHVKENLFTEKPHAHDFYLILLITKGSGLHTIDFQDYKVFPGALFIVSPGQIHQWNLSEDTEGYILFFTKKYFLFDFDTDKLSRFPFFNSTFSLPFFHLTPEEQKIITIKYRTICKEYHAQLQNHHEMIRMTLNAMFIELTRIYEVKNENSKNFSYDILQLNKFESLVDTHFLEHQPVSFYSNTLNISDRQLGYLCKKTVNKAPSEILMERILLEAKRLIIHSNLSISAISLQLNYTDTSYFIRLFKRITKQTPEQFRAYQYNR